MSPWNPVTQGCWTISAKMSLLVSQLQAVMVPREGCVVVQTVILVDTTTWGLLVPLLRAHPDPKVVAFMELMIFNFTCAHSSCPLMSDALQICSQLVEKPGECLSRSGGHIWVCSC